MRWSGVKRWRVSVFLHGRTELTTRWQQLYEAAPGKRTNEALSLLEETVCTLQRCEAKPEADAKRENATPASHGFLADRATSLLIWKTLRRQRVPWQDALMLKEMQLSCVALSQREFIARSSSGRPWSFSHAVLASWDLPDPSLIPIYRELKGARSVVAMSQTVSMALRSRPELQQVLPVTVAVLRRCHALGLAGEGRDAARLALSLEDHLSLLGAEALSVEERESLALGRAWLHGRTGNWAAALQLITSSSAVRLTQKAAFATFVKQRELFQEAERLPAHQRTTAVAHAPTWAEALALLQSHGSANDDDAKLAFLSRADVASLPSSFGANQQGATGLRPWGDVVPWQLQLDLFISVSPSKQTYRVLRPVLERVPLSAPDYIVTCAKALGPVAARMYAGTLTRRVHALNRKGNVAAAVSLCCAAGYYDVAAALTPRLSCPPPPTEAVRINEGGSCHAAAGPKAVAYELPEALLLFSKTANSLTHPGSVGTTGSRGCDDAPATPMEQPESLPELLAHALVGDWQTVAQWIVRARERGETARLPTHERLLALVRARALADEDRQSSEARATVCDLAGELARCYTFASPTVSQLVCRAATEKDRAYFAKVIPRSLHAHHFGTATDGEGSAAATQQAGSVTRRGDAFRGFLGDPSALPPSPRHAVSTVEDCHWLLQAITDHLRAAKHGRAPSGVELLKAVARACATGQVRLRSSDAFGLSLATLKASYLLQGDTHEAVRMDSLVATAAVQSTPSHFLDGCAPAVAAGVDALLLTGNVRVVQAAYRRWSRKEKERTAEVPTIACVRGGGGGAQGGGEHLADVFLRAAFSLPKSKAQAWAVRLWRDYRQPSALVLQELLVGDTRQVADLLRQRPVGSNRSRDGAVKEQPGRLKRETRAAPRRLSQAERRCWMGMAFSVLDSAPGLRFVVNATGKQQITATDVDEHGFHRLLRALPGPTALAAVEQLCARRPTAETVEELWLLMILCKPSHGPDGEGEVVEAVARLVVSQGSSSAFLLVNCHCALLRSRGEATGRANPSLALKAIVRFTELVVGPYSTSAPALFDVLSVMLRQFSDGAHVVRSLLEARADARHLSALHRMSHRVLNLLLSHRDLEDLLRKERREMWLLLRSPEAVSPVLLLGWLHHALSHHQQRPVAASFTSRLLRLTAEHTKDWQTAFHFFSWLRHPTNAERLLLLQALRCCTRDLTSRMQHTSRFLLAAPELVLVWADVSAAAGTTGEDPPQENASFLAKVKLSQEIIRSRQGAAGSASPLQPQTQELVKGWKERDCARALNILRQVGLVKADMSSQAGGTMLVAVEEGDEATQAVLHAIQHQQQQHQQQISRATDAPKEPSSQPSM